MEWQRMETAPRDGTWLFVCSIYEDGGDAEYDVAQWVERYGCEGDWWNNEDKVYATHWMLPEPPKGGEA